METKHDKVCPTCGSKPCGSKQQAAPLPYWPWITIQPIPYVPVYPYITWQTNEMPPNWTLSTTTTFGG